MLLFKSTIAIELDTDSYNSLSETDMEILIESMSDDIADGFDLIRGSILGKHPELKNALTFKEDI